MTSFLGGDAADTLLWADLTSLDVPSGAKGQRNALLSKVGLIENAISQVSKKNGRMAIMLKEESPTWKDPIVTGIALEHNLRFCYVNAPGEQGAATPLPGLDEFVPAHGSNVARENGRSRPTAHDCLTN